MRSLTTILSLVITALTLSFSLQAKAAGETGHSDLVRLLSSIYGLNVNASEYMATVNQAVDNVMFSAATNSGRASNKLHFAKTVTNSDLDQQSLLKMIQNNGKRTIPQVIKMLILNRTIATGVSGYSDAEAAEALGKALKKGDGLLYAMGLHYLLDTASPFHVGYLGSIHNPVPLFNRIPFLREFAFGHLADGTSPDKLNVAKIVAAMDALGPFLITLRETQRNQIGVNQEWLDKLTQAGVDIQDSNSIRNWFLKQPEVEQILQHNLPARRTPEFTKVLVGEIKDTLTNLSFFKDPIYLDQVLENLVVEVQKFKDDRRLEGEFHNELVNDLLVQMIDKAWKDGQLNERRVINHSVTDYAASFEDIRTLKLEDLIVDRQHATMPDWTQRAMAYELKEKSLHAPFTREWILDKIVYKITKGMVHQKWSKFDTSYQNPNIDPTLVKIEGDSMRRMEKHFFSRAGKYFYNPGTEHWLKVFASWKSMSAEQKGKSILEKIATYADLVVRTKLRDGERIHTLPFAMKFQIFVKSLAYVFIEEAFDPRTSRGNFGVMFKNIRERIIEQVKQDFPEGMLTQAKLEKFTAYNEMINRKFNSDEAVGFVQKTAAGVKKAAEFVQRLTGTGKAASVVQCITLFK